MKRLGPLAGAVGLVFAAAGCSTAILARYEAIGLDRPANSVFAHGSTREEVEAKLGKPDTSRTLLDGTRVDTYTYTLRNSEWRDLKWMLAVITMGTLGLAEAVWVPWAVWEVSSARRVAAFTYDLDDRVLDHGPPPRYGPPDDSLEPLSFAEIRERCQSEIPVAYRECVVRRIAIWGID